MTWFETNILMMTWFDSGGRVSDIYLSTECAEDKNKTKYIGEQSAKNDPV